MEFQTLKFEFAKWNSTVMACPPVLIDALADNEQNTTLIVPYIRQPFSRLPRLNAMQ
jgi:hypothetical protein